METRRSPSRRPKLSTSGPWVGQPPALVAGRASPTGFKEIMLTSIPAPQLARSPGMPAHNHSLDAGQPRDQPVHLGLRDTRGANNGGGVCHGARERLRRAGLYLKIKAAATDLPNSLPRGDVCPHTAILDGQARRERSLDYRRLHDGVKAEAARGRREGQRGRR